MKTPIQKQKSALFMNVPVGALIRFNGYECKKLDKKHVRFVRDAHGKLIDYSKKYNQRYARTTQQCIEGTPVTVLKLPVSPAQKKAAAIRTLLSQSDALLLQAKRLCGTAPALIRAREEIHTATLHIGDADALLPSI